MSGSVADNDILYDFFGEDFSDSVVNRSAKQGTSAPKRYDVYVRAWKGFFFLLSHDFGKRADFLVFS